MAVQLDPPLLEILACPSDDHAPLTVGSPDDPEADVLTCTSCGRQFRVEDGIPVLLLDEAIEPAPGGEVQPWAGARERSPSGPTSARTSPCDRAREERGRRSSHRAERTMNTVDDTLLDDLDRIPEVD